MKPANVLLNAGAMPSSPTSALSGGSNELGTGRSVAGTPTYMAPELFEGVPASHRSDIYAAGVMFYYLLSARLPFASDQIRQLVQKHQRRRPSPTFSRMVPTIPDAVIPTFSNAASPNAREIATSRLTTWPTTSQSVIATQLRDTESLSGRAWKGLDCFVQGGRDLFRVLFRLPGDRLQEVYVEVSRPRGRRPIAVGILGLWPGRPQHYEFALRLNDQPELGSLSVRNVQRPPHVRDEPDVLPRPRLRGRRSGGDARNRPAERPRRTPTHRRRPLLTPDRRGQAVPQSDVLGTALSIGVILIGIGLGSGTGWSGRGLPARLTPDDLAISVTTDLTPLDRHRPDVAARPARHGRGPGPLPARSTAQPPIYRVWVGVILVLLARAGPCVCRLDGVDPPMQVASVTPSSGKASTSCDEMQRLRREPRPTIPIIRQGPRTGQSPSPAAL